LAGKWLERHKAGGDFVERPERASLSPDATPAGLRPDGAELLEQGHWKSDGTS